MIADLPREPRPTEPVKSVTIILIIRYLRSLTNYVMRLPRVTGGAKKSSAVPLPFTLFDASEGETLKVGIIPGTVNGVSPTFTGAAPAGVLSNDPPPLLTITETTWFFLKVVGTFGDPDSYVVTIETNTTGDIPDGTEITGDGFTSFLRLGIVPVAGGAIQSDAIESNCSTSLGVESLGNFNFWWRM